MALVYQVIARPEAQVPDLAGRVEGAARLADLMRRNALPQATPAAHVLPAGIDGGRPLDTMGIYRQEIQRLVAVVLTVRTHDRTGGRALEAIEPLLESVLAAIAGWAPAGHRMGVCSLRRGRLASFEAGTLVYEFTFALADETRIKS